MNRISKLSDWELRSDFFYLLNYFNIVEVVGVSVCIKLVPQKRGQAKHWSSKVRLFVCPPRLFFCQYEGGRLLLFAHKLDIVTISHTLDVVYSSVSCWRQMCHIVNWDPVQNIGVDAIQKVVLSGSIQDFALQLLWLLLTAERETERELRAFTRESVELEFDIVWCCHKVVKDS